MSETSLLLLKIQKLERELAQLWRHRNPDFKLQAQIRAKSDERTALKKQLSDLINSSRQDRETTV